MNANTLFVSTQEQESYSVTRSYKSVYLRKKKKKHGYTIKTNKICIKSSLITCKLNNLSIKINR